jgi:hypothetical protein
MCILKLLFPVVEGSVIEGSVPCEFLSAFAFCLFHEVEVVPGGEYGGMGFLDVIRFVYRLIELMLRLKHVFRYFILNSPFIPQYFSKCGLSRIRIIRHLHRPVLHTSHEAPLLGLLPSITQTRMNTAAY